MVRLGGGRKAGGIRDIPPRWKPRGKLIISLLSAERSATEGCSCEWRGLKPGWPEKAALLSDISTELSLLCDSGELMLGEVEFL